MTVSEQPAQDEYTLKNLLLAYPADWYIDKAVFEAVKASLPALTQFYDCDGVCDPARTPLHELIKEPIKEVFTAPLFSETFVRLLRDEIEHFKHSGHFVPNPDEDELRQIPELVLQEKIPVLHRSLMAVVQSILNPMFLALWNRIVTGGGIQIANYNPREKQRGAWHHDHSADITVVVPLNTGDYVGGGTEFYGRGTVEPLPNGNALIFPAFTHLHRGLPVESGDRYLLVFWLTFGEENE